MARRLLMASLVRGARRSTLVKIVAGATLPCDGPLVRWPGSRVVANDTARAGILHGKLLEVNRSAQEVQDRSCATVSSLRGQRLRGVRDAGLRQPCGTDSLAEAPPTSAILTSGHRGQALVGPLLGKWPSARMIASGGRVASSSTLGQGGRITLLVSHCFSTVRMA